MSFKLYPRFGTICLVHSEPINIDCVIASSFDFYMPIVITSVYISSCLKVYPIIYIWILACSSGDIAVLSVGTVVFAPEVMRNCVGYHSFTCIVSFVVPCFYIVCGRSYYRD